ncbi:MAG: hypothetical protein JWQ78_1570, partial [Sediminibacterium sp.]|nr:hypothetical protein [Sediminibacterium sp.]
MEHLIQIYLYLPLAGFLLSLLIPRKKERIISALVTVVMCAHLLGMAGMLGLWIRNGWTTIDLKHLVLFKSGHFEFFINFYFDQVTAVYMLVGSVITSLVMVFSRYYMHRDEGFKRFFNTILFFYLGYNLVIFAGNFETLFIGWEILGITSFLLIAFYRDRYLPVRNGLKVISLYRLGDVCLILAMWMAHHLFQKNITFAELQIPGFIQPYIQADAFSVTFIALMVLIAVAAKSAQLPFSSWLPRAMEGPTTSSAIFYGSLSVHLGVFLLLRTYPLWQDLVLIKIFIIVIGVTTALVATGIAKVQSSVKTQIAYSSITQIAIIFIEVALGFHTLALVHFSGNAFLRTYQLLVSPSVLGYLIHDQFFNHAPTRVTTAQGFVKKVTNTVYLLSVKEWNLDRVLYRVLWNPFKWAGKQLNFLDSVLVRVLVFLLFAAGLTFLFMEELRIGLERFLPELFSVTALAFIVKAFTERGNALRAW